jgi:hypothetical protein
MAFEVKKIPGGGGFFKPPDHLDDLAILIEVRRFEAQRPGGIYGPKDTICADLTVFKDAAALDGGTPEFISNTLIQHTVLVADLETLIGEAAVAKLVQSKSNTPGHKPAFAWREVEASVQEKVVAYATARDEALAAAMADAPDF